MIKSDGWITKMAQAHGMIEPFAPQQVRQVEKNGLWTPAISYGVSSYGYDIRVDRRMKVLDPARRTSAVVDPKRFDLSAYEDVEGDEILLPPHGMAIAQSLEYFRIPREVLVVCQGKSTYSRCGIQVSISPLEPEWEGRLTFAISNQNACAAKVYGGEGIAQILFFGSDAVCNVSYADKQGKYQKQAALTPPRV
jgi:dCTP deaminase